MRKVTELRLFQDLQYEEIARIQGVGTNSVRSQLFEARKRLKPVLDDYFQGVEF
jgi:DNA-directed RNA polymerase specialized sigma24 family protein